MNMSIVYGAIAAVIVLGLAGIILARVIRSKNRRELPGTINEPQLSISTDVATPRDAQVVQIPEKTVGVEQKGAISAAVHGADDQADLSGIDEPESVPSRMQRLRARLAKGGAFGKALLSILSRDDLSASDWEELEDTLILADVGLESTAQIINKLKEEAKVRGTSDPDAIREVLREELVKLTNPAMDRSLSLPSTRVHDSSSAQSDSLLSSEKVPAVILMVGVNGTGKTTTAGKLARLLVAGGYSVVLGAADTFRAAAADQLETWGKRVGVPVVRSDREGADPASVAFDAVRVATEQNADVVLVDTAGRLQNKAGLMDELGKIKRVIEKKAPVCEVLLVLDATTGQNGMQQAKVFADVTGLTGIVLTKLDGTAKGGIVISVQREIGVPVKFVGLGEGVDDLAPFDPQAFVDSLLDSPAGE